MSSTPVQREKSKTFFWVIVFPSENRVAIHSFAHKPVGSSKFGPAGFVLSCHEDFIDAGRALLKALGERGWDAGGVS